MNRRRQRYVIRLFVPLSLLIIAGYLVPERYTLPVADMNAGSFNHQSFWYYPWGASIRHKGVDIFAAKGKNVYTATSGIVLSATEHPRGGKMVLVLGPKWHIHHYLHLDTITAVPGTLIRSGTLIGKVGNSGNAAGKPSHLHYAITTPLPYLWQADRGIQGWKKIWYIDPTPYLLNKQHT